MTAAPEPKLRLGISRCLLGEPVRYDGGHKLDPYLHDLLGRYCDWVPVCPEVEAGMSVPREPLHLTGEGERPRVLDSQTQEDWTERLENWAEQRVNALAAETLVGFVFKSGSPSCGLESVPVHTPAGDVQPAGQGIFAGAFRRRYPWLPKTDERQLTDAGARENFVELVFAYQRWLLLGAQPFAYARLRRFHVRHHLQLLAHSPERAEALERLLAGLRHDATPALVTQYRDAFLGAIRVPATVQSHGTVLLRIFDGLKTWLDWDEQKELKQVIDDFQDNRSPFLVPLTLIRRYLRKYPMKSLREQTYLDPDPREVMLRWHA